MPEYRTINARDLDWLREQARIAKSGRARIFLHASHADAVQEMVICLRSDSYVRAHRHPKPESYHVIEGELVALLYTERGEMFDNVRLNADVPIYRLDAGIYHAPRALTEFCIYHEVYAGPWTKEVDVLYADWAEKEVA